MALQTAREMRMARRRTRWIAGRVVTFEALFVGGNIRMDFRIPLNGRTMHAEVVAVRTSGGQQDQ